MLEVYIPMNSWVAYGIDLILLFFLYSFAGWCIEVILKYIQYHRFINRGFLTGPICPIYGTGALLITVAVELLTPIEKAVGTTFVISFLLCGAVEYITSYVMEKRFHARWWDYSRKPMNLNGRIWIGNLMLFGLGGVAIIHLLNPILFRWLEAPGMLVKELVAAALLAVTLADYAMTHLVLKLVKLGVENSTADSTEEISREIRALLSNRSMFYQRFADAYPEVIYRTDRVKRRLEAIKAESERIRREAEERLNSVSEKIEPTALIKAGLIEKQDRLIALTYDADTASDAARELKAEIDEQKARLQNRPLAKIENRMRRTRP